MAWKLTAVQRGEAKPLLRDTYRDEQGASAQAVMDEMRFNVLERPNGPLLIPLLRMLMPFGLASQPVPRQIEWTLSDLAMHYRDSTLSWHAGGRQPVRAGDRVPDVPVMVDHNLLSLHRLLSLQQSTLLLNNMTDGTTPIARVRAVIDGYRASITVVGVRPGSQEATQALGRDGTMLLVRPDRHIGLLTHRDDVGTLQQYLDTFLVRQ